MSEDEHDLQAALRAGAHGYLLKTIEGDLLAQAIHRAMRGEPVISSEMTGKLVTAFQTAATPPRPGAAPGAIRWPCFRRASSRCCSRSRWAPATRKSPERSRSRRRP